MLSRTPVHGPPLSLQHVNKRVNGRLDWGEREIRGKASWEENLLDAVLDAWLKSVEACGSCSRLGGTVLFQCPRRGRRMVVYSHDFGEPDIRRCLPAA